ncbi:class I SAM-dependent methyltransferase [Nonomuraea salmonea]|uniref:Class I SAM-dependent methyltransferase n=1 Tax=Nonomuraea salmonea TaxID=46181 RepID=A0ABV5NV38_9ACTN
MDDPTARTTATYDRIAPEFAVRSENPDATFLAFRARFAAALPAGGRVADLGCGPGRDAAWFREQGFHTIGVDRSAAMAALAAARGVPVALGDLRHPPLVAGSLAGLWSAAALLHVPADETVPTLRAFHAALRPGGVLGLSTSAGDGADWEPVPHHEGLVRWFVHRDPQPLLAALTEIGFEVREHAVTSTHRTWLSIIAARDCRS